jgi:hypothetical protein
VNDVRPWLASASWACLCGIAGALFLTIALVGLFVLFFGALISAMLAPLLMLLPADWQWTGWQIIAVVVAVWLAVVLLFGAIARLAWIRCRAVTFAGAATWPRTSSVVAGIVAALLLLGNAGNLGARFLPQEPPQHEPERVDPVTV